MDPLAKWDTQSAELFCGGGTDLISDLHSHCPHVTKCCSSLTNIFIYITVYMCKAVPGAGWEQTWVLPPALLSLGALSQCS